VRTIVDLRGLDELEREPNPFAAIDGIRYEHRPLNDPGVTSRISVIEDSTERYRVMLDGNGQRIAAIMNVIATSPRAVLFHCFAGRDRTGIIAAVLLRLAGVADEAIVEDYAISDERLVTRYDQWRAKQNEVQRARMEQSIAEADATIRGTLDHLDAKHGGVEAYLLKHGLDPAAIGRLKNDLIG
jgi:protein-tyrosine phosphatase